MCLNCDMKRAIVIKTLSEAARNLQGAGLHKQVDEVAKVISDLTVDGSSETTADPQEPKKTQEQIDNEAIDRELTELVAAALGIDPAKLQVVTLR